MKHQIFTWKLANFCQYPYINETNMNFTYTLDTYKMKNPMFGMKKQLARSKIDSKF